MKILSALRLNGEVSRNTAFFLASISVRLGSSLVLTRILTPEAYGSILICIAIVSTFELLSDFGLFQLIVRESNKYSIEYIQSIWTVRLIRSIILYGALFLLAPFISDKVGGDSITLQLRLAGLSILLSGLESCRLQICIRDGQSSVVAFYDFLALLISVLLTIVLATRTESDYALVFGLVCPKALIASASYIRGHGYYATQFRLFGPAIASVKRISAVSLPAGALTLATQHLDKLILSTMLNKALLGTFNLAQNISSSTESLGRNIATSVLYPRYCKLASIHFREDCIGSVEAKAFMSSVIKTSKRAVFAASVAPAYLATAAPMLIGILYDARYSGAAAILAGLSVRALLAIQESISVQLLLSAGFNPVYIIPVALRAISLLVFSSIAYALGDPTFLWIALAAEPAPALIYCKYQLFKKRLASRSFEIFTLASILSACLAGVVTALIYKHLRPS